MLPTAVLALAYLLTGIVADKLDPRLTRTYFDVKKVAQIAVFACWNESDALTYNRRVIDTDTRISYHRIGESLDMWAILRVNYYKLGIVLDMDCPGSHDVLLQFSAARLPFNESYVWLSVSRASQIPWTILEELPLTVESEFTLALGSPASRTLYDVYNHSYRHGGRLNVTLMGHWDGTSMTNHLTQYKYKRRQDFHGLGLNFSVTLMNEPVPDLESYLTQPVNRHLDTMSRFHYNLVQKLRDMYNFKINLRRARTWGYVVNGTFNGILGQMMAGVVDISVAPFQYKRERFDACEFTVETYVVKPYFMFRHPKRSTLKNPFLKPFKQNVWWLVLNVSFVCWLLLLLTLKIEKHYHQPNDNYEYYKDASSETALITMAALSQQGLNDGPRVYSGRIVFITLFLWALLMYQFYSASIVGSLLAESPKFINSITDLADSNLQVAFEDTAYTKDHFLTTSDPASLYLWRKKLAKPPQKINIWTNASEGISEMRKGGYAFFIDSAAAYKKIEDTFEQSQICELSEIELVRPQYVSIVTSKRSPFKKMIIYGLRQMVQSGLTRRLFKVWHHRKPKCPESFRSQPIPVEMQDFSPAVFIVASGLLVALTVLGTEHLVHRLRNHRPGRISDEQRRSLDRPTPSTLTIPETSSPSPQ